MAVNGGFFGHQYLYSKVISSKIHCFLFWKTVSHSCSATELFLCANFVEGLEGVKRELGFAFFALGKWISVAGCGT